MDRRSFIAGLSLAAWSGSARAFAELSGPRRHLIMRHALAPGYSDPAEFEIGDCATQRNLDARGREQARRTGERLRGAGLTIDRVLSSQWCRCLDTARLLGLGPVEEAPELNSFFEARDRRAAQTEATRRLLLSLAPSVSVMLVTHQVNITALLGGASASGEVFAFEIGEDGATRVLASMVVPA